MPWSDRRIRSPYCIIVLEEFTLVQNIVIASQKIKSTALYHVEQPASSLPSGGFRYSRISLSDTLKCPDICLVVHEDDRLVSLVLFLCISVCNLKGQLDTLAVLQRIPSGYHCFSCMLSSWICSRATLLRPPFSTDRMDVDSFVVGRRRGGCYWPATD
jgi:hypothetical protein